ncbi:retrovirus-related pol polyprotein from transposon TNT 1-94 [Tanacetum coccineum]|uniref:Retrovirus-related pol polyprotein from transposon TNT 1-94 n=1 Tax=Tanacetum coccineum TaxID=301880 RepID=A0ABQ4X4Y2_9ASTR
MEAGGKDRPPMLALGNYVQWKSRIKRYIDTKPNNELIHYYLQNPPYKFKWTEKTVPVAECSSETTTKGYMENYMNVSQDIRDQLNAEAEAVQIILTGIDNDIYSIVDACPNACEMWKAIERLKQGESINVQDLETNLYWEFGKFTSQDGHLNRITQEWKRSQQSTRNRGKAVVNSFAPIYDQEPARVTDDDEMSKEKEIDKLMALISLSGTGYDNQRVINVAGARDNVAYHKEKMLLYKQEEARVQLNTEQADWKDDTDDESDDQELEAYYMYMAQIQEVTLDSAKNSRPIFDAEPLHKLVEIILFIVDSGCSKHMTGNLKLLTNFVEKFLGMVNFGNDQIAPILGYGDLVQGTITIKRVYYVEGLNHNLFSVGQFCDADLEVTFRKSTCYIRVLKGNDLLTESINGKKYVLVIVDDYSRYTWTHFLRSKDETLAVLIDFLTLVQRGLHAQVRTVQTDKERRNRTLVEAARTMLSAAKVPLFFWVEAIATAYFTQNHSLIIPLHKKTPYHIINARKSSLKFFHIFSSLCYIIRDGENLDKMKEKGDTCIFVGYSTQSRAYRVFNKRTRIIIETIHVNFDEFPQMASDHVSSDRVPQCSTMVLKQESLSPDPQSQENVPQVAKTVTTSNELELLYSPIFNELLNGSTLVVSKSSAVHTADAPDKRQHQNKTHSSTTTVVAAEPPLNIHTTPQTTNQAPTQVPTVTAPENIIQADTNTEYA